MVRRRKLVNETVDAAIVTETFDIPDGWRTFSVYADEYCAIMSHVHQLLYPMKRARADCGKNTWARISWDEAYDIVERRFKEIKDEFGAESVIFAQGTGRDIAPYITRLAWSFGSPNYTGFLSGLACFAPRMAGMIATTGCFWIADCSQQFPERYDNPEYQLPETMFIWGNYPLRANSDGMYGRWITDMMQRGMKIVMIDPKVIWLSARAETHLRVGPGTDAALALGASAHSLYVGAWPPSSM